MPEATVYLQAYLQRGRRGVPPQTHIAGGGVGAALCGATPKNGWHEVTSYTRLCRVCESRNPHYSDAEHGPSDPPASDEAMTPSQMTDSGGSGR